MQLSMKIYFEQFVFNFLIIYAKYKTDSNEITLIKIHKPIPCINGFIPTDFFNNISFNSFTKIKY